MSETPQNGDLNNGAGASADAPPSLRVLAQYLKDLSFESPRAPACFSDNTTAPGIEVNVDVNARGVNPNQFEVELAISAKASRENEPVFVVETSYAGVFEIMNVPENQIEPILLIECPRLLFPFARQIVAETTTSGNFPPVMLDPIDFLSIYQRNQVARQQQQGADTAPASA